MKHKLLLFMAIGGAATALNFALAGADSPTLAPPDTEVCRVPIDPPTTTEPPTTTTEPTTTTTEPPTTTTEPTTTTTEPTTTITESPTATTGPPPDVHGLRTDRTVVPDAKPIKYIYKVTHFVSIGPDGFIRSVILDNPCQFGENAFTFLRLRAGQTLYWRVRFPKTEIEGVGCFVEVYVNGVKQEGLAMLLDLDGTYEFTFNDPKLNKFAVGFVINCF